MSQPKQRADGHLVEMLKSVATLGGEVGGRGKKGQEDQSDISIIAASPHILWATLTLCQVQRNH